MPTVKGKEKITEAEFQRQVLELAKLHKWRSAHFRPGMTAKGRWVTAVQGDGKGFPDTLLIRGRELVVAELKVGKNKVTPEQAQWLTAFAEADIPAFVWTPEDWPEIVIVLSNGPLAFRMEGG